MLQNPNLSLNFKRSRLVKKYCYYKQYLFKYIFYFAIL